MDDSVKLGEAFNLQVDVDLNLGSIPYSAGPSHNYRFRIFLSKMADRITGYSTEGKIPFCDFMYF